jgi:alpha-ketoglutarate-dependent taurine dioxygenase
MKQYEHVRFRSLEPQEIKISTSEREIPLVVEPHNPANPVALRDFLVANSDQLMGEVARYGAVLFRNFDIPSEAVFEEAIASIKEMRPMDSYLLAEPGRVLVEGSKFVFYTNKGYKTGGSLRLGGFHTENFYTPDVPGFISFWCLVPSQFGGETGLVQMRKVYRDLPESLKAKLEKSSFYIGSRKVSDLAKNYSISGEHAKKILAELGLSFADSADGERVVFVKPVICDHPITGAPALVTNLSGELPGLNRQLRALFLKDYAGWQWTYHRLVWRFPFLGNISYITFADVRRRIKAIVQNILGKSRSKASTADLPLGLRYLETAFTDEEVTLLAKAMRDHFVSFTWKRGDILLIDNLQIAHAGMPGFGDRVLRVVICNPVRMDVSATASGRQKVSLDSDYRSISSVMQMASSKDLTAA